MILCFEQDPKRLSRKLRLVEGVAARLRDFVNAMKALDRMHHCLSHPNFAVSAMREVSFLYVSYVLLICLAYMSCLHVSAMREVSFPCGGPGAGGRGTGVGGRSRG